MKRETFVAVMKRKDVKALGAIILREVYGENEKADELEEAGRLTVALIDRTCVETTPAVADAEPEASDEKDASELDYADEKAKKKDEPKLFDDIRKAIKKGKGKKALKLCVKYADEGHKGSVLKDLRKQAKAL